MHTLIANSKRIFLVIFLLFIQCRIGWANDRPGLDNVLRYIHFTWKILERSTFDCKSLVDPKTHVPATIYLPHGFKMPPELAELREKCNVSIHNLPQKIHQLGSTDTGQIKPHGLLYLPYAYVVPGGIFNEMYGWDSYFIILGLLHEHKLKMAYQMVENFFFEIEHYGGVLNGNRTYYLSRSQPPFLTSMIREVYAADVNQAFTNLTWLKKAYRYAVKDYNLWTKGPHVFPDTNLSRYYDFGHGPVPELNDSAESYYVDITKYYLLHHQTLGRQFLKQLGETSIHCEETKRNVIYNCRAVKQWQLNDRFYAGDRAMRESGFDTSFRFGAYSGDTINYSPIDLMSLLYKAEIDLAWMSEKLGHDSDKKKWLTAAKKRRELINKVFFDPASQLYYDYNFKTATLSKYEYATTFYPLWLGIATKKEAKGVVKNLKLFEKNGGLVMSPYTTGVQWDAPYGWAPIQLIAVQGLHRYGYHQEADRIAQKFTQMIIDNYAIDQTIREKYDVLNRTAKTNIEVGYKENMVGFGWTNGVFLKLIDGLNQKSAT